MKNKLLISAVAFGVAVMGSPSLAAVDDSGMKYTGGAEGFWGSFRANWLDTDGKGDSGGVSYDMRMGVQGTSDLGGGMQSFYYSEWRHRTNEDWAPQNAFVGVRGNFGELYIGKDGNFNDDHSNKADLCGAICGRQNPMAWTGGNQIRYVTPNTNGFVGGVALKMDAGNKNGVDGYDVGAHYTHASGFSVYGGINNENVIQATNATAPGLTAGQGISHLAPTGGSIVPNDAEVEKSGWKLAAGYSQDNWTVGFEHNNLETEFSTTTDSNGASAGGTIANPTFTQETTSNAFAASITFDRTTLVGSFSMVEHELGSEKIETDDAGFDVAYKLSSTTTAYVGYYSFENDKNAAAEKDTYGVRLRVNF